jgi:geranylgeranyl pyrophosphate synthase
MALGEAFQATDDALDLCGDPHAIGKPIAQDLAAGEITIPVAIGCERDAGLREEIRQIWQETGQGEHLASRLAEIRDHLEQLGAVTATRELALSDGEHAISALAILPKNRWRKRLADLVNMVAHRKK